jgi:hypothetical protein
MYIGLRVGLCCKVKFAVESKRSIQKIYRSPVDVACNAI